MPEIYRADGRAVCGSVSDLVGPGMQVSRFRGDLPQWPNSQLPLPQLSLTAELTANCAKRSLNLVSYL